MGDVAMFSTGYAQGYPQDLWKKSVSPKGVDASSTENTGSLCQIYDLSGAFAQVDRSRRFADRVKPFL
ncbi:hypothetical protein [Alcanivorax sp.]|uniref:hypothetical protein n=1 Tax=Alcanivorax sp. TaxID=1872427 RepID=UPI003A94C7D9